MANVNESYNAIISAVENNKNFVLEAGAGSGKTFTLVQTLLYLCEKQLKIGQKVLCITYTNVAKDEIKERLNNLNIKDKFIISTMHDFLWDFFSRFQSELQKEVEKLAIAKINELELEISRAQRKIDKPRANTNFANLNAIIEKNTSRLEKYKDVDYTSFPITYDTYRAYYRGIITHDDIIDIANIFFKNDFFVKLFVSSFPYVLIDEYQDSNYELVKNIIDRSNECEMSDKVVIGLYGDKMQQIYDNTGELELSLFDIIIEKTENYRTNSVIVNANNIFRNDKLKQSTECQNTPVKFGRLEIIYNTSKDINLSDYLKDDFFNYKRLYLSNRNIADEIGFGKLSELFGNEYHQNANEKLLKLDDPLMNFFIDEVFEMVKQYQEENFSKIIHNLNANSIDDLGRAKIEIDSLLANLSISLKEFITIYKNIFIFNEKKFKSILESYDNSDFIDDVLSVSVCEFICLKRQIDGDTTLSTMHGVKGDEFENVIVNIFENQNWKKYNFDSLLANEEKSTSSIQKAHKLLYVACTRAKNGLILNYVCNSYSKDQENSMRENVKIAFGDDVSFTVLQD